jgi:nucleoside 2-deoxyribosyltransferase
LRLRAVGNRAGIPSVAAYDRSAATARVALLRLLLYLGGAVWLVLAVLTMTGSPEARALRIFLSGIIQGSHAGSQLHDQSYREALKRLLHDRLPESEVVCPVELHPNGITYNLDEARAAFFSLVEEAAAADLVVAYLPEASMGTAIEMWQAYHLGRPVLTITPLRHNWVVNLLSRRVFASLEEFAAFVDEGGLERVMSEG